MEVLDRAFLLENVDNDQELLAEIVELFLESTPDIVKNIRAAVTKADPEALNRSAHQLKGALANVGAKAAAAAASNLESLGRSGTMTGLEDAMSSLESELDRLEPELKSLTTG